MGPSGSGKSTMMNMPRRARPARAAAYLLEQRRHHALDPDDQLADIRNRKIASSFQNFNLPRMPVRPAGRSCPLCRQNALRACPAALNGGWATIVSPAQRAVRRPAAARRHRPRPGQRAGPSFWPPTSRWATSTTNRARMVEGYLPAAQLREAGITILFCRSRPWIARHIAHYHPGPTVLSLRRDRAQPAGRAEQRRVRRGP